MVVRLSDLQKPQGEKKKSGIIRLSDLHEAEQPKPAFVSPPPGIQYEYPNKPEQKLPGRISGRGAVEMDEAPAMDVETRARQLPVIGPALKGLDIAAEKIEPVAAFLRSFITPGAGLANVAGFAGSVGSKLAQLAPKLGKTVLGRVGTEAIKEGVTGVPVAMGQALTQEQGRDLGEVAKQGLLGGAFGAVGGAAIGGAVPLIGAGLKKLKGTKPIAAAKPVRLADLRAETPPTPTPRKPVQPAEIVPQERGLVTTLRESERLTEPVQRGLEVSPARTYEPITNIATVEAANRRIAQGMDKAESYVMSVGKEMDAERVATGFRLIDELQNAGNFERAITVAENLAEKLTRAGQTVQAASIWNRLTPEGALVAANRIVNRVNESLPKWSKEAKISEKTASDIANAASAIQASKGSQQRANDVMDILDRIRAGEEVSLTERQFIIDFVQDARKFVEPPKAPRPPRMPNELKDPRLRDRIVSSLDSLEQQAKERLRARGISVSSNPLDVWGDYAIIGAAKLGKGAVKFSDWSEQMVKDLGEGIRPHLSKIYERAQETLAMNSKRIREESISKAENIAEAYVRKNKSLKPEDINEIRGLARQVSTLSGDARQVASQDLQAILNSFERAGIGKKLSSLQYISMLLNPKTQVRNIVGNELMYRLERLNRMVATPIDWASSKLTGSDRQITWRGGQREWGDFFKDLKIGARAGWKGIEPEGLSTAYDIRGQAFKGKLNPFTYAEKTLGAVMKGPDYAAYNRAVQQRLGELGRLDAINKGIRGADNIKLHTDRYISNVDKNIDSLAKEYGKYVTFQDETALSRGLQRVRSGLNLGKDFGLGSLILPFVKTPANLLMRAIEYSPAGILKAIGQTAQIIGKRNTDLTRADVINSVTRAILGTGGLGGAALWLADKGVITGDLSQDRDVRELQRQAGLSNFQVNASALQRMVNSLDDLSAMDEAAKLQSGDTLYQYEWAQPTSIPIALGANIVQERKKPGEKGTPLQQGFNATMGALNTLMNTSVLRGLQQAFDLPPGEENKVKAFGFNILRQLPSMFTPTIANQINQLIDSKVRETYSPEFSENLLNPARARIPILAKDLPQDVTTLGQPVEREMNELEIFLSPAQRSKFKPTPEAKMVMDLLMETGEERIAPRAVPKYIEGTDRLTGKPKRIDLTGEQFIRYQTLVGQETLRRLGRVRENWSTERKVEEIIKALNEAGNKGRNEMRKELGLRVSK